MKRMITIWVKPNESMFEIWISLYKFSPGRRTLRVIRVGKIFVGLRNYVRGVSAKDNYKHFYYF